MQWASPPARRRKAGRLMWAVGSCLLLAAHGVAAQEAVSEQRIQITLATPDLIHKASIGIGQPVVVSRADVESPFVRIRSIEEDVSARLPAGTADPAFKAVLLTPRASTGRPVQPQMANLGVPEDATIDPLAPSKVKSAPVSGPTESAKATPAPPMKETRPPSQSQQKSVQPPAPTRTANTRLPQKSAAVAPQASAPNRTANTRPPQKSAAVAPQASAPRYGAAEVQAVRAFTRF
jgi:hypothetical protein